MPTARYKDDILAITTSYEEMDGNVYFPARSINLAHFMESPHTFDDPVKGKGHYYTINAGGRYIDKAAWCFPDPSPEAAAIKNHFAFSDEIDIEK